MLKRKSWKIVHYLYESNDGSPLVISDLIDSSQQINRSNHLISDYNIETTVTDRLRKHHDVDKDVDQRPENSFVKDAGNVSPDSRTKCQLLNINVEDIDNFIGGLDPSLAKYQSNFIASHINGEIIFISSNVKRNWFE